MAGLDEFEEGGYCEYFHRVTGLNPYPYQTDVAEKLWEGRNIILRAPTGAGKTWSVLVPFLHARERHGPFRLIYAVPLRTLAQGIYREAQEAAQKMGIAVATQRDHGGREMPPFVTMQTGDQPDDPFFDRGKIIVTTYDQVLSGLLDGPYGLSGRLHNVNAAAIVGALVVFDEFHLMPAQRAFLTAAAGLRLFRGLCQSVWMTATATMPLQRVLDDSLAVISIPDSDAKREAMLNSLPSVTGVRRELSLEVEPLTAEAVLGRHKRRSIVLLNTVARAQAMFEALRERICEAGSGVRLILLHSRFFREDRRVKEAQLVELFGKGATGSAILVATQVVEAGLDISSDSLHTELCPMNALVQRAGRCARFAGEMGTVHVYALPPEERSWLPYGDLRKEDDALARTRAILERVKTATLNPSQVAEWVQEAHGVDDERALREGWWERLRICLGRIEQNAIIRDPKRVADLIRGEDTDSVRVVLATKEARPSTPGQREGVSLSRWSIARLLRESRYDLGWAWDPAAEEPWKPLETTEDLQRTYAVCLRPNVAAYDSDLGLRLGVSGVRESPPRAEPARPGHDPLRAELWTDHARCVADEATARLARERWQTGLIAAGFEELYQLSPQALLEAVRACGLLHDLGKLQNGWQRWAEAAQQARDGNYRHVAPLAHTDFNRDDPADRERERRLGVGRPAHAAASAFYGGLFLAGLLPSVPEQSLDFVASACAAAVLAHHGGWLPRQKPHGAGLGIDRLWPGWAAPVADSLGWAPSRSAANRLEAMTDKRGTLGQLVGPTTTSTESLQVWWPLVSYLTRTLRLADQRATAERGDRE